MIGDPWDYPDAQAPAAFAAWAAIKSGAWDRHLLALRAAINHRMIVNADPAERLGDEPVPYWPAAAAEIAAAESRWSAIEGADD